MVSVQSDRGRAAAAPKLTLSPPLILALVVALVVAWSLHSVLFFIRLGNDDGGKVDGIFVISLQGSAGADGRNEGRLDAFRERWKRSCGEAPDIVHCPGAIDARRGYGLTKSWLGCLERAKNMDLEVSVIFEDDARLFDRAESLAFCDPAERRRALWAGLPDDAFLTFLGGHSWRYANAAEGEGEVAVAAGGLRAAAAHHPAVTYRETAFSYGTYGFAVPRRSLDLLLETIRGDVANGWVDEEHGGRLQTAFLSPEKSWYRTARLHGKRVYAASPLVVWHEGGFSNTWKKDRGSITGEEVGDAGGIRGVATKK